MLFRLGLRTVKAAIRGAPVIGSTIDAAEKSSEMPGQSYASRPRDLDSHGGISVHTKRGTAASAKLKPPRETDQHAGADAQDQMQ